MNVVLPSWCRAARTIRGPVVPIVLAALIAPALAVSAFEHSGPIGGGSLSDLSESLHNPLAYFAQRSPGARDSADLIQLKHRVIKAAREGIKPHERSLANARRRAGPADHIEDFASPVPASLFEPEPAAFSSEPGPAASLGHIGTPSLGIIPAGSSAASGGDGGGGGGVGAPGGSEAAEPDNNALPEPATWSMLMMGMALVGMAMRSKAMKRNRSIRPAR